MACELIQPDGRADSWGGTTYVGAMGHGAGAQLELKSYGLGSNAAHRGCYICQLMPSCCSRTAGATWEPSWQRCRRVSLGRAGRRRRRVLASGQAGVGPTKLASPHGHSLAEPGSTAPWVQRSMPYWRSLLFTHHLPQTQRCRLLRPRLRCRGGDAPAAAGHGGRAARGGAGWVLLGRGGGDCRQPPEGLPRAGRRFCS